MIASGAAKAIQAIMDAACRDGRLDAASLAIHASGETDAFAAGMANVPEGIAATIDTVFHIGSATKAITAEIVWRLIGEGRLSPDMPVIDAAPELGHLSAIADRRLTPAHLLSHTGGVDGDVIFEAGRGKDVLRRFMAEIPEIGSLSAPGAHFSYANIAFNILARISEVQGGVPFQDALGDLLRKTYGLSHVAIVPDDKIRQRTALHFTRLGEGWLPTGFGPWSNIGSGTILAMSMSDLARWGAALLKTKEVSRMVAPAVELPFNHRYQGWGYGVSLLDGLGTKLFGHDGGTAGTATFLRIAPGPAVSWAFSATGNGAVSVYRELEPLVRETLRLDPAAPRVAKGTPPRDLAPYVGRFERGGMFFEAKDQGDGTLRLTSGGPMSTPLGEGLVLRPLTASVFEAEIASLKATIWVSFHDFAGDGKPRLFFVFERMTRRTEAA